MVAVAGVLAALALLLGASELPAFFDSCHSWGAGAGSNGTTSMELRPGDACRAKSATSETKLGAALRLAAVDGTVVASSALAAVGALRGRRLPLLVAAALMGGETLLLFLGLSAAFLVVAGAGALYLAAGLSVPRRPA